MSKIPERLKAARKKKRLTQKAVGELAGLSQGTIANIEGGRRRSVKGRYAVAKVLDVPLTVEDLLSQ